MKPLYKDWAFLLSAACAFAIVLLVASCATRTPSSGVDTGNIATVPEFDGEYSVFVTRHGRLGRFIDRELNIVCYLWTNETFRCMPIGQEYIKR